MLHGDKDTPPSWLIRARRELGVREGKNDTRILQYRSATKQRRWVGTSSAWCADFIGWCLEQEGVSSTKSAGAASYRKYGRKSELRPGAVVFFGPRDPDSGATGHVAFVNAYPEGDYVECISGNCGNAVRLKKYLVADVLACRWPEFP